MPLLTLGLNHQTAPVDIREKITFSPDQLEDALIQAQQVHGVKEAVIVSTCNRTELYCECDEHYESDLIPWIANFHNIDETAFAPYLYQHKDADAVQHLYRVASGLDSLVLGEPQILGQLKSSFESATQANSINTVLGRLFQSAFTVAKRVRTETDIGSNPVSVAFAAVSLAKQIFGDLSPLQALMIGAGETIELAARHLQSQGIGRIIIANRTLERAQNLALELGAKAAQIGDIPEHLTHSDIVISSTASQLPILGKGTIEAALKERKYKPIFMVDIAVPRDIEPQVEELEDVFLYTVDDLKEVIDENQKSREAAAKEAEIIVKNEIAHFEDWLKTHQSADEIRLLRSKAEELKNDCLNKALMQIAKQENTTENIEETLQSLATCLCNKMIHGPTLEMRKALKTEDHKIINLLHSLIKEPLN
ncbi:MAG: glutamyl-tRNA reductase [Gammaproteobacteria bacterium]|nr:glutamyl-tRNA reductase [Gammaproteobacteria bacterium]